MVAVAAGVLAAILAVFGKPLTGLLISGLMAAALPIADIVLRLARPPGREPRMWHATALLALMEAPAIVVFHGGKNL